MEKIDQRTLTRLVSLDRENVIKALEHDHEFFINFFLGDELIFPVPNFHLDIFNKMVDPGIRQFVCAIPRDHAKTTLAKLACLWFFLFSKYRFILYVSNTSTIAQQACIDIVNFLESDNFIAVFGRVDWLVKREGEGLYKFKLQDKVCVLRALGA